MINAIREVLPPQQRKEKAIFQYRYVLTRPVLEDTPTSNLGDPLLPERSPVVQSPQKEFASLPSPSPSLAPCQSPAKPPAKVTRPGPRTRSRLRRSPRNAGKIHRSSGRRSARLRKRNWRNKTIDITWFRSQIIEEGLWLLLRPCPDVMWIAVGFYTKRNLPDLGGTILAPAPILTRNK